MNYRYKHIFESFFSPFLLNSIRAVRHRWRSFPYFWTINWKNASLRNRHLGQECFILGNGPSLKTQDLRQLRGKVVFAVNFFNLHPQCEEISPHYYMMIDRDCFRDDYCLPGQEFLNRDNWFLDVCNKFKDAEFLFPIESLKIIKKRNWFKNRKIWWIPTNYFSFLYEPMDLRVGVPHAMNVISDMAIPAALFMGFSKITILGCEMDWIKQTLEATDLEEIRHFYHSNKFISRETNTKDIRMDHSLRNMSEVLKRLYNLSDYATRNNQKIINATPGGILDMFQRGKLEEQL